MMVGSRFCICVDRDRTGPKLLRSGTRCRHGGAALHAGSLWSIGVEIAGPDDAHAVVAPAGIRVAHFGKFTPLPRGLNPACRARVNLASVGSVIC